MDAKIYVETKTPRQEYIFKFVLSEIAGLDYSLTTNLNEFNAHKGIRINYSKAPVFESFNIYQADLLNETGIRQQEILPETFNETIMFFRAPAGFDFPFDIFSTSFYLVSRYEEYLPFKPDKFGRFEADQSLAYHQGFLDIPIIDLWVITLKKALKTKFHEITFTERQFKFISTIDVDNPWAYLHKGLLRTSGGLLKSLFSFDFKEFTRRISILARQRPDPFDTYEYLRKVESDHNLQTKYFFLTGNYGNEDSNYALHNRHFRALVHRIKDRSDIGMHPSFRSSRNEKILRQEFEWFSVLMGHAVKKSRQHFLMVHFPETFKRLMKLGIHEDYSLGYASHPGFRAGTCTPFYFYDLKDEKETGLLLFPFAVMDVTLQQYMNYKTQKAQEVIHDLISEVKQVNGTFISLWHNESLCDEGVWKGWKGVFEEMVKMV